MEINLKKLNENAVIPKYAKLGDAGMDLTAISRYFDMYGNVVYGTGLAIEIPEGYMGLLFPRSSNSKKDLSLCNSVGVIDSGYRGEIIFKFKPALIFRKSEGVSDYENKCYGVDSESFDIISAPDEDCPVLLYEVGEKVGQLIIMPYPQINFIEVDQLSSTDRGADGFGSTDKI